MARSMLVYQDLAPEAGDPVATVVALHGHGGTLDELVPLCREIHPSVRIVTPQAARPVNAADRTYSPEDDGGYRWYFGEPGADPEPATFGESLWKVEQFVYDVRDRMAEPQPIVLVGRDQGALIAVTMATIIPDCLAGVVAIGGCLPVIRGWTPPAETLDGLPILFVDDPEHIMVSAVTERTVDDLQKRNGAVTAKSVAGVCDNPSLAGEPIREWFGVVLSRFSATRAEAMPAGGPKRDS